MISKKIKGFISVVLVILTFSFLLTGCSVSKSNGDDTFKCETADGTIVFYRHELTDEEKKTTTTIRFTVPSTDDEKEETTIDKDKKNDKAYQYYYIKDGEKIILDKGVYKSSDGTIHIVSIGFYKDQYDAFMIIKNVAVVLAVVVIIGTILIIAYKGVQYEERQKKQAREQNKKKNKK